MICCAADLWLILLELNKSVYEVAEGVYWQKSQNGWLAATHIELAMARHDQ